MQTLEATNLAFSAWRNTRSSKRKQIPENLKKMVKDLVPHYKKSHICKTLRISGTMLKLFCLQSDLTKSSSEGFVKAVVPTLPKTDLCELALDLQQKMVNLKFSIQHLPFLLSILKKYV